MKMLACWHIIRIIVSPMACQWFCWVFGCPLAALPVGDHHLAETAKIQPMDE
jgi:hypothetical protein